MVLSCRVGTEVELRLCSYSSATWKEWKSGVSDFSGLTWGSGHAHLLSRWTRAGTSARLWTARLLMGYCWRCIAAFWLDAVCWDLELSLGDHYQLVWGSGALPTCVRKHRTYSKLRTCWSTGQLKQNAGLKWGWDWCWSRHNEGDRRPGMVFGDAPWNGHPPTHWGEGP